MKRATVASLLLITAPAVHAHLVETGFGAFYNGLAHVAMTPGDLLIVVALALLAGQRGASAARWTLLLLPLAWLVGGVLGSRSPSIGALPLSTTLTFLVAGALVALNASVRDAGIAAFVIGAGLLHGFVNGATMGVGNGLALAGAIAAVFCLTILVAAEVSALPAGWPRVVVRVVGSWIAAAGLLMLGWLFRAGALPTA